MFYNAKNHTLTIDGDTTDFISFGKGKKNLVIIPGVGDGLKTAKVLAIPFAFMYRLFAKDFTVYIMSRKRNIPENYSTQQMAADMHKVLQSVGVEKTSVAVDTVPVSYTCPTCGAKQQTMLPKGEKFARCSLFII